LSSKFLEIETLTSKSGRGNNHRGKRIMLRYRITRYTDGRYLVLPAPLSIIPISETYATRAAARDMADWLNGLRPGVLDDRWGRTPPFEAAQSA